MVWGSLMFWAQSKDGASVCSLDLEEAPPAALSCPGCGARVSWRCGHVRDGAEVRAHFYHVGEVCKWARETAAESEDHKLAKVELARKLRAEGSEVRVEVWLDEVGARPDVLEVRAGARVAHEIQTSPITPGAARAKRARYAAAGIECLYWFAKPPRWAGSGCGWVARRGGDLVFIDLSDRCRRLCRFCRWWVRMGRAGDGFGGRTLPRCRKSGAVNAI